MQPRRKITNATRSWVFRTAHKSLKRAQATVLGTSKTFGDFLKLAWDRARKAAGIIANVDLTGFGIGNTGRIYSIKALAAGRYVPVNRNPRRECYAV